MHVFDDLHANTSMQLIVASICQLVGIHHRGDGQNSVKRKSVPEEQMVLFITCRGWTSERHDINTLWMISKGTRVWAMVHSMIYRAYFNLIISMGLNAMVICCLCNHQSLNGMHVSPKAQHRLFSLLENEVAQYQEVEHSSLPHDTCHVAVFCLPH